MATRESTVVAAREGTDLRHEARAVYVIWLRDLVRFVNERTRLVGALGQPLIYLGVMGTGFGATFRAAALPDGFSYVQFMFPGILGMTVLFTALFSAVSIIWDREFGFLKEVLVAPVTRPSIVLGKALGGATVALLQATLLLALSPLVGLRLGVVDIARLWLVMLLIAFALTSFGLALASRMPSMEAFQMVMNFLIVPMWMLSGAFFPLQGVPGWMAALMRIDPLTYAVDALRGVMYAGTPMGRALVAHGFGFNLTVVALVSLAAFAVALVTFKARES
ncbi:MAG TPA: ABC transporter permease [Bacillota bacterium]